MKILGIDPGIVTTGYACLDLNNNFQPSDVKETVVVIAHGSITPKSVQPLEQKLKHIHCKMKQLISELKPDVVVVEDIYSHTVHPNTGLKMGHAKGVIELAVSQAGIKLSKLSATKIKKAVIGQGNATKEQLKNMIENTYNIKGLSSFHESDAVACALAYAFTNHKKALLL